MYNNNQLLDYLKTILNTPSPSGYTQNVMNFIRGELDKLRVCHVTTNKGGLIATIKGENNGSQRTFSAHVDTLGAMVKGINASGTLSINPIGGFMMNSVEGENCEIHTLDDRTYSATLQTTKPSVHISGDAARNLQRTPENMEVVIDEKVFSKEDVEKLGISVGDFISFDTRTRITDSGFIKSRYLDDKASAAILLYTIKYITENNITLPNTINFYISNYEEVGHGASSSIPQGTKEFISVDMGAPGVDQNSSEYSVCICAKDSSGPYDFLLRKKLTNLCIKNNISYKTDIYPYYGSDASAVLRSGWDVKAALIGPGVYASHGYERTHIDSMTATLDLVIKYCFSPIE